MDIQEQISELQEQVAALQQLNLEETRPDLRALATVIQALVAFHAENPAFHAASKVVIQMHLAEMSASPITTLECIDRYHEVLRQLLPPDARME